MNRIEALAEARKILVKNKIDDAALEGEILLRHVLKFGRAQLFLDLKKEISTADFKNFIKLIKRRVKGEPTAYIIGIKEFYGLDFEVNKHVLVPRPETELLVEQGISLCQKYHYSTIADVGTGCGAIAISLSVKFPSVKVYATDISSKAFKVARRNAAKHSVLDRITFLKGDMLKPLPEPVELIVANMPYVKESDIPLKGPLSYEPKIALNGGQKGIVKIRELCHQAGDKLSSKGSLLIEIGQGQEATVKIILHNVFPAGVIEVKKDLAGIDRVVSLRLT